MPQFKQKTATLRAFLLPTSMGEDSDMRRLIFATAALALVSGTSAQAAQDAGLNVQNYRSGGVQSGVGAQLGMTLKLDSKRAVREIDRVQIGFAAGPVMMVSDARTGLVHRGIGSLAGFGLRPGYSATLTFAGQPIATRYTVLGKIQDQQDLENKNRNGISTAGKIGIGIAVIAVVGLIGAVVLANEIASNSE